MIDTVDYVRFTRVDSVTPTEHGLVAELHGERLRVDVIRPDLLRLMISRGGVFDENPTFALCVDPLPEPPEGSGESACAFAVESEPGTVRLRTASLTLSLALDPFCVDVHRADGTAVVETARDEAGEPWAYATLNDAFTLRRRCRQQDAFFGLGEKTGRHNRKGRDLTLWNNDVLDADSVARHTAGLRPGDPRADPRGVEFDPYYVSIPLLYHQSHPAGTMSASFLDNGYRVTYELSPREEFRVHATGGQYTEYVFAGPDMPHILEQYTWLTGRTALPPLWTLGYHQCRWFHYTQAAVEELAGRYRAEEIPCDALWLDIEHMDGYRVFTWDASAFPDPPAMLARLAEAGFRVVTIVDPGVKLDPGYWVYDQAVERDVLCRTEGGEVYLGQVWPGRTAFPDFVTEEARQWWGELNAAHARSGIAGIWNDMNEPATGRIDPTPMRFGHGAHPHERYHNQYALLMAMATTTGLREALPQRRPFVLSRAGSAGIQRYAANWMGDNVSRWDHLALSIPMAAGLGISGQPFVGADIGGFAGDSNAELFLRWMQHGVLTPFCRNHSELANVDQYAWSWGPVVQGLVRAAVRLRYRLLPYLYAAFLRAHETGAPVQRPLVFDHQYDLTVRELDEEYLLGPDLLVAPVTEAGATARQVYLPDGDWYDWHSGEPVGGARFLTADTPMDRIPVYARGGAVIPLWPDAPPSTAGYHPDVVDLHLFVPQRDGRHTSLLQEDDGETTAAEAGAFLRTAMVLTRSGGTLTLVGEATGDGYPEHRRRAFHLHVHGAAPDAVRHDGVLVRPTDGAFVLPNRGGPFTLSLEC